MPPAITRRHLFLAVLCFALAMLAAPLLRLGVVERLRRNAERVEAQLRAGQAALDGMQQLQGEALARLERLASAGLDPEIAAEHAAWRNSRSERLGEALAAARKTRRAAADPAGLRDDERFRRRLTELESDLDRLESLYGELAAAQRRDEAQAVQHGLLNLRLREKALGPAVASAERRAGERLAQWLTARSGAEPGAAAAWRALAFVLLLVAALRLSRPELRAVRRRLHRASDRLRITSAHSPSAGRRILFTGVLVGLLALATLGGVELSAQIVHRLRFGSWYFDLPPDGTSTSLFVRHPYLVARPQPGAEATLLGRTIRINAQGYRGPDFPAQKAEGVVRIATLGGSTTYGTLASEDEIWPRLLQQELGPRYEVINLGVPGYSTVENLIQTALHLPEYEPDIAIYFVGWNDARNSHIRGLQADYSDFHGPSQYTNLGLNVAEARPRWATLYLLRRALVSRLLPQPEGEYHVEGDDARFTDRIDARALELYERNLRSIIALCRLREIRAVFAPQVLNYAALQRDGSYGWFPFVRDRDLEVLIAAYNRSLREVVEEQGGEFLGAVLDTVWSPDDFVDEGHFSVQGHRRFAQIVARHLAPDTGSR